MDVLAELCLGRLHLSDSIFKKTNKRIPDEMVLYSNNSVLLGYESLILSLLKIESMLFVKMLCSSNVNYVGMQICENWDFGHVSCIMLLTDKVWFNYY